MLQRPLLVGLAAQLAHTRRTLQLGRQVSQSITGNGSRPAQIMSDRPSKPVLSARRGGPRESSGDATSRVIEASGQLHEAATNASAIIHGAAAAAASIAASEVALFEQRQTELEQNATQLEAEYSRVDAAVQRAEKLRQFRAGAATVCTQLQQVATDLLLARRTEADVRYKTQQLQFDYHGAAVGVPAYDRALQKVNAAEADVEKLCRTRDSKLAEFKKGLQETVKLFVSTDAHSRCGGEVARVGGSGGANGADVIEADVTAGSPFPELAVEAIRLFNPRIPDTRAMSPSDRALWELKGVLRRYGLLDECRTLDDYRYVSAEQLFPSPFLVDCVMWRVCSKPRTLF